MRKGLSRVPLLAMRAMPHDIVYRPAARLFSQIQSGGSVGEPIVFLGDSLTSGAGVPFAAAYPALLSEALGGRRFVNLGVGGEVSGQIVRRYRATPSLHKHPVVIWAGRNNYVTVDRVMLDLDDISSCRSRPGPIRPRNLVSRVGAPSPSSTSESANATAATSWNFRPSAAMTAGMRSTFRDRVTLRSPTRSHGRSKLPAGRAVPDYSAASFLVLPPTKCGFRGQLIASLEAQIRDGFAKSAPAGA